MKYMPFMFIFWGLLSSLLFSTPADASRSSFTLLHSAGVQGLASSYHYGINTPYFLLHDFARQQPSPLQSLQTTGAAIYFHHQGHYLWGDNLGVKEMTEFLAAGPEPTEERRETINLFDAPDSLMLETSPAQNIISQLPLTGSFASDFPAARVHSAELRTYANGIRLLITDSHTEKFSRQPHDWEMLLGLKLKLQTNTEPQTLSIIGKPTGEGSRRVALLKELKDASHLLVDSGNLLEGLSSVNTASLSLQRSNSLSALQKLGYFALNIGAEELRGGLTNLLREQEYYQLPFISASIRQKNQLVFPGWRLARSEQHLLAVIGLGNPDELENLKENGLLGSETEILSPETALKSALDGIQRESGQKPDVVVLLTTLQGEALDKVLQISQGTDVVLGDTSASAQNSLESVEITKEREQRPFVAHNNPRATGILQIELEGQRLTLRNEILPIDFDLEPDPEVLKKILHVRQQAYRHALDTLLPDLGPAILNTPAVLKRFLNSTRTLKARQRIEGLTPLQDKDFFRLYPPRMTAEIWADLISNILLEAFDSEIALVEAPEDGIYVPGTWPRLLVYELFKQDDTLAIFYLNGDQLGRLLKLKGKNWISGGIDTHHQVWGRPLQNGQYYRTLISSGLFNRPDVYQILKGVPRHSELKNPYEPSARPETLYLRNLLLSFFEQARREGQLYAAVSERLQPRWQRKQSLFSVKLSDLQLNFSGYNALNNQSYTAVRETRVSSPDNLTYGGRSKLSLIFDNEPLTLTQSVQARYESLSLRDEKTSQTKITESQDDLLISSEMQLHLFEFPAFGKDIQLIPYLEGLYDTEFTPTLQPDGKANPRQSELSGVAGLTIPGGPILKAFKTGLAVRRDFNVPDNLELGINLKLDHDYPLSSNLRWNNSLDLRYYLPGPRDNESSLGLITQWVSAVKLSLTDHLALRFFADAYLFQGKLPATSQLGASVILGVGLSYDRLWKPAYELNLN
jgi:hypothetical protein